MPATPQGSGAHPLVWLEIAAPQMEASMAFYSSAFGWSMQSFGPSYCVFGTQGGLSGGLTTELGEGQQSVAHIYAKDLEAAISALEAAGGSITHAPQQVMEYGKKGLFTDPAGTTYGLSDIWPGVAVAHIPTVFGDGPKPPAGSLCSIELYGGDLAACKAFFEGVFGWGTLGTMPQYMAFDPGAGIAGVFQAHTAVAKSMPYIWVDDVQAAYEKLEAAGGKRMCEAMAMPGMGTFGYFTDPSGTAMGLIGP
jgi:predicted enzyme related to lactoylglutathione lyase